MQSRIAHYYDEVFIIRDGRNVSILSPWMEMKLDVEENFTELDLVSSLDEYPFVYLSPRRTNIDLSDISLISEASLSPVQIAECLFEMNISSDIRAWFSRKTWSTNVKEILEFSRSSEEEYDPATIYTILRRLRYSQIASNKSKTYLTYLDDIKGDRERFHEVVIQMIAHNYYVTANCQKALDNLTNQNDIPLELILPFIAEEKGHDFILRKALVSIGAEIDGLSYYPETKMMMNLLALSCKKPEYFASFCCLLELFEGSSFHEVEPRAKYLANFPEYKIVAECLQKHHKINLEGNHFSKGLEFLKNYRMINQHEAIMAIRIFEVMRMLEYRVSERICVEIK